MPHLVPEPPSSPLPVIYRIDASNRITWVSSTWEDCARANARDSFLPTAILGQDLLAWFADSTVRALYTTMIRHVRAGKAVRFDYRCDTVDRRRTFAMEIGLRPDGEVEFTSVLVRQEMREPAMLLRTGLPRDKARFIRMCSWCQDVALPDGRWVSVEDAVAALRVMESAAMPQITHGMCEACHGRVSRAMDQG